MGAYEMSLQAMKTSAVALTVSNVSDEPVSEFDETYLWPLITAKGEVKRPARATTSIKNRFDAFGNDEVGSDNEADDEEEMIKALSLMHLTDYLLLGLLRGDLPCKP